MAIENLDVILEKIARTPKQQSVFRRYLVEESGVMFLVTSLKGDLDRRYSKRMFHSFTHRSLTPWDEHDFRDYFAKRTGAKYKPIAANKIRALRHYTGGSPRMAVILADLVQDGDPLTAAETLDQLVEYLTPYYQDQLRMMEQKNSAGLFGALLREGEPCSQTELAKRVGATQNQIAQSFSWLRENEYVYGERRKGGRDILYRVVDRVLAYFARKRFHLIPPNGVPLLGMTEFLTSFYLAKEMNTHAVRLFTKGDNKNVAYFAELALKKQGLLADDSKVPDTELLQTWAILGNIRWYDRKTNSKTIRKELSKLLDQYDCLSTKSPKHLKAPVVLENIVRSYIYLEEWKSALDWVKQLTELWKTLKNNKGLMRSLNSTAFILYYLKKYEEGIATIAKALDVVADIEDHHGLAADSFRIKGYILYELGRFKDAIESFERAFDKGRRAEEFYWLPDCQRMIGSNWNRLGQPEKALEFYRKAIDTAVTKADPVEEAICYYFLGSQLLQLQQTEKALEMLRHCIHLSTEQGLNREIYRANLQVAAALDRLNQPVEALFACGSAIAAARKLPEMVNYWGLQGKIVKGIKKYAHDKPEAIWQLF